MAHSKESVVKNNKYAVLHANGEKHWFLLEGDDDLKRWREDGRIKEGDIVIALKLENIQVALLKHFIELK